jgi:hypothetical protein
MSANDPKRNPIGVDNSNFVDGVMSNRTIHRPSQSHAELGQKRNKLRSAVKCIRPKYVIDGILSVIGTMVIRSTLGAIKLVIKILKYIG